jgi:adenylate cyclase
MSQVQRKLTTILAADAAGYSRVMESDEVRTLTDLRAARGVFSQFIARHHGRIANTAGDGLIAEFPSVVEAVQCAIEVQRELDADTESHLRFRIGIHLGDARLQSMADPGGILISQQVYDQVQKKLSVGFAYLGEKRPKNFEESVAVYSVGTNGGEAAPGAKAAPSKPRRAGRSVSERRARFVSSAQRYAMILALLAVLDLMTGDGWWVQWPALGVAFWLALRSGPMFERAD